MPAASGQDGPVQLLGQMAIGRAKEAKKKGCGMVFYRVCGGVLQKNLAGGNVVVNFDSCRETLSLRHKT